jgi:hypothetical protein
MNALLDKVREIFANIRRRTPDVKMKPARDGRLVTPALYLTPDEIMAAVEAERNNPKRQAEVDYYRAKCTQHLGGSR